MKNLRRLKNWADVKTFKPRALQSNEHNTYLKQLRYFKKEPQKLHLEFTFQSEKDFDLIMEKMNKIGRIADSMDHHPDWTLSKNRLTINLNTHDIKDISQKDYLLAYVTQNILDERDDKELLNNWNRHHDI